MQKRNRAGLLVILMMVLVAGLLTSEFAMAQKSSSITAVEQDRVLININEAGIKELSALDGIGKKKAETIIAYRESKGLFKSIDDLKQVDGIGKKTIEKIRGRLVLQ
ncbi:MAG: helix-hairpin-helix domain-containing protein [Nitrospira sp.]|nr:helix-hairpin-helix domain-containing protein [bacterium]MBL7049754.1 helix-hairpin-helix domain-containing protein [Nitrospira sp.]